MRRFLGFAGFGNFLRSGIYPTVNPIIPTTRLPGYSVDMKTKPMTAPTLGGLIMNLCNTYGTRKAKGIFRLMVKSQLIGFREFDRHVSIGGKKA